MLNGVDVSGWNKLSDIEGADFVIIKATEGVGWKSDMLPDWIKAVCGSLNPNANKRYGFYHYARPETGNSAESEADWFYSVVKEHAGYACLALDYEGEALKIGSGWALRFLKRLEFLLGYKPLFYVQASAENSGGYNNIMKEGFPLWLAHYSASPTIKNWPGYTIWQCSDKPVDKDVCESESWAKIAPLYAGDKSGDKKWRITNQDAKSITLENSGLKIVLERG